MSLVGQWIEEAKSKLQNPGLVYSYHGSGRKRDPVALSRNSIVVTTYETLQSDASYLKEKSGGDPNYCAPCEQVRWWRIICDESQNLRTVNQKSRAVAALVGENKWLVSGTYCQAISWKSFNSRPTTLQYRRRLCSTGTPINTTVHDFKNQLDFLGIESTTQLMRIFRSTFFTHVNDPQSRKRDRDRDEFLEKEPGVGLFAFLMRPLMMRHSQQQMYTGTTTELMSLPPKVSQCSFSSESLTSSGRLNPPYACLSHKKNAKSMAASKLVLNSST